MKKIALIFLMLLMMTVVLYSQQESATVRMYFTVMETMFKTMGMDLVQIQNPPAPVVEFRDFVFGLSQRHYSEEEFMMYQMTTSNQITFVVVLVKDGTQWFSRYYAVNIPDNLLERFF